MLTYSAETRAAPDRVWELLASPKRWHEWAPHVRGARGLGAPEIEVGRRGSVLVLGLPLPARTTALDRGRSWAWRVGGLELDHQVAALPGAAGSRITVSLAAPRPLEPLLRLTYGPLIALLVRNLARVAERSG